MKKKIILIIVILIFLVLGVVTYNLYTYKVSTATKVSSLNKQIKKLKNNIDKLEKNNKCDNKCDNNCDSLKNIISDLEKNVSDNEKCNTCNVTVNNDKGQLITEELNGMDVLYVTDAIKNGNYYTLKGVIYTAYILTDQEVRDMSKNGTYTINSTTYTVKQNKNGEYELYENGEKYPLYKIGHIDSMGNYYYLEIQTEVGNAWKKTNIHKEIVISANTPIDIGYDKADHYKIADDVFKNYKSLTTVPDTTNPPFYYAFKFEFKDGKCVRLYNEITGLTLDNGYPY